MVLSEKALTRPSNISRCAPWTVLRSYLLCMATPLLHKIHNHKSAVVSGVKCQKVCMSYLIKISEDADDIPCDEVLNNSQHNLNVTSDEDNSDVHLKFSSREAMRDFAKSILHESYYGSGVNPMELYPLDSSIVDGVRLTDKSNRVFIWYPKNRI